MHVSLLLASRELEEEAVAALHAAASEDGAKERMFTADSKAGKVATACSRTTFPTSSFAAGVASLPA
jgi:hypothetical protein